MVGVARYVRMSRWIHRHGRSVLIDAAQEEIDSRPLIYVSGPTVRGGTLVNVRAAIEAAEELRCRGYPVYVPHLYAFWDLMYPRPREEWTDHHLCWLEQCDALLRLPGPCADADREVEHARNIGLAIFASIADIETWVTSAPRIEASVDLPRLTFDDDPDDSDDTPAPPRSGSNGANGANGA